MIRHIINNVENILFIRIPPLGNWKYVLTRLLPKSININPIHKRIKYFTGFLVYLIPLAVAKINKGADSLPSIVNHKGIGKTPVKV
jgi:hypothetical protein